MNNIFAQRRNKLENENLFKALKPFLCAFLFFSVSLKEKGNLFSERRFHCSLLPSLHWFWCFGATKLLTLK